MTKDEIVQELWWDIRGVGYLADDDDVKELLMKAYQLGHDEDKRNDFYDY